ncbi:hypothetical protein Pmani_007292 [Petrolisthes manimaculis]|uniref:Uncharacterized protein n=1 Tax=Petrolisthes manimaculis TaxID=1843537 RepID=A0AAE1Q911_9EUCA|nr:hypothetical protein Pmani_007292 [Petrolisthes manimaculis]
MGQVQLKPLLGDGIENGLEAIVLLDGREEGRSHVVHVRQSATQPQQRRSLRKRKSNRIQRYNSVRQQSESVHEQNDEACEDCEISDSSLQLDMEEQQLADVYYSAFYLHPPREILVQEGATALVPSTDEEGHQASTVTRDELKTKLKEIFDVDERTMVVIEQEVLKREPPTTTLHITLHEAKNLKPKTPKETSHPFCFVRVIGNTESETRRTPAHLNTLSPEWEHDFKFCLPCPRDAKLVVEVWHEPQEGGVEQLRGMKDLRELGRMVRDAAANLQTKETRNMLGTVTVPLSDAREHSVERWYDLAKDKEDGKLQQPGTRESFKKPKKRGSIRISFKICTSAQLNLIGPHWYNGFLNRVVHHHLQYMSSFSHRKRGGSATCERGPYCYQNNFYYSTRSNRSLCRTLNRYRNYSESSSSSGSSFENEVSWKLPTVWDGTVHRTCSSLLDHYSTTLGLSPAAITLSWWNIASEIPVVDQSFLGKLLKQLQEYIAQDMFSQHDIEEISSSVKLWAESEFDRLRNLTTHFPAASSTRVIAQAQIKWLLANFHMLQANSYTQCLPRNAAISELVSEALMNFVKNWWENTLKNRGHNSTQDHEDQQLEIAVALAGEVCSFLTDVSNFYHDVFLREAKISYLKLTYLLLTSELAARVRPLLHKIYDNQTGKQRISHAAGQVQSKESDKYCLEAGTPVWRLYKKLAQIQRIGENLPTEVQLQSGLLDYHQWFLGAVTRWQERLMSNTRDLITKQVEMDTFEIVSTDISASAAETMSNFIVILKLWEKLAWPDDGNIFGKKLVKDLCGLGTLYTKLVISKLETGQKENFLNTTSLSLKNCTILNNIEFLRREIHSLLKPCDPSMDNEDDQFSVVSKTLSKMEGSILCNMDSAIRKLKPTLYSAVVHSCETANENLLLHDVLDKDLCVLRHRLNEANLKRLLLKLWNNLIVIFCSTVNHNLTKRKADYFKEVYRVMEKTWYFFTPADRNGLDPHHAHTQEYQSLQKMLHNRMMSTESLISKYYKERNEELQQAYNTYIAELVVRVFFHVSGKLLAEVIIARNIQPSLKSSNMYVQLKLVPGDWFPKASSRKTSIQKRNESLYYQQNFEWSLSPDEAGVKNGYLLFLLKINNKLHSDEVAAETVLSLEELPTVDTTAAKDLRNQILYMNMPRKNEDYTAVKALKSRTWDKRAQHFLKTEMTTEKT